MFNEFLSIAIQFVFLHLHARSKQEVLQIRLQHNNNNRFIFHLISDLEVETMTIRPFIYIGPIGGYPFICTHVNNKMSAFLTGLKLLCLLLIERR